MRVVLDNETITASTPPAPAAAAGDSGTAADRGQAIAHAVREARHRAASRGRVIVDAQCAGQPVDLDALATELDLSVAPAGELRLTSAEPSTLVISALRGIAASLSQLEDEQHRAATEICCGRVTEASARLPDISAVWQRTAATIGQAQKMLAVFGDQTAALQSAGLDASTTGRHMLALSSNLKSVKAALASEDWSALADVLEFGLCETSAAWADWLSAAADALTPTRAGRPAARAEVTAAR